MEKYILIEGHGQYGALGLHLRQMAQALEAAGKEVILIDGQKPNSLEMFMRILQDPITAVISSQMAVPYAGERNLVELRKCGYVTLIVDHPGHHRDKICKIPKNSILYCLDQTHIEYIQEFYPRDRFRHVGLMPPGGNTFDSVPQIESFEEFHTNRDIPILFTGTLSKPEKPVWHVAGDNEQDIWNRAFEKARNADAITAREAIEKAIDETPHEIRKFVPKENFLRQAHVVSTWLHFNRRWNSLLQLGDANLPIHAYGNGWEKHLHLLPSFHYGGKGSFQKTLHLLKRTKIVLNSNTNFLQGAHERVFAAMLAGAAVVSDESTYYRKHFEENKNIALYKWSELADLPRVIRSLLDDPKALYELAQAGKEKAWKEHTWNNRIEQMLRDIQEYLIPTPSLRPHIATANVA